MASPRRVVYDAHCHLLTAGAIVGDLRTSAGDPNALFQMAKFLVTNAPKFAAIQAALPSLLAVISPIVSAAAPVALIVYRDEIVDYLSKLLSQLLLGQGALAELTTSQLELFHDLMAGYRRAGPPFAGPLKATPLTMDFRYMFCAAEDSSATPSSASTVEMSPGYEAQLAEMEAVGRASGA